jgi:hypothetical protein
VAEATVAEATRAIVAGAGLLERDESRWCLGGAYGGRRCDWPQCRYCGRAQNQVCPVVVCPLCGSRQCRSHSECAVCLYGWLPGWARGSEVSCGYEGCDGPAVARAPGVGRVCKGDVGRVRVRLQGRSVPLDEFVAEQLAQRDAGAGWQHWAYVK